MDLISTFTLWGEISGVKTVKSRTETPQERAERQRKLRCTEESDDMTAEKCRDDRMDRWADGQERSVDGGQWIIGDRVDQHDQANTKIRR